MLVQVVIKSRILVGPSLVFMIYYLFSLSDPCPGVEKKIFKEKMHYHYLTLRSQHITKTSALLGHEVLQFW